MKASELIEKLQEMIKEHDDLEVVQFAYEDFDIEDIEYVSEEEKSYAPCLRLV